MARWVLAVLAAVALAMVDSISGEPGEPPAAVHLDAVRRQGFSVISLDSKPIALQALLVEGRPVIVEFWATWCAPCQKLTPIYTALASEYAPQGLVVVGLAMDEARHIDKVKEYVRELHVGYATALAPVEVYRFFNNGRDQISVPRAFFFDSTGRLVSQINGLSILGTERRIRKAAAQAVAGGKR